MGINLKLEVVVATIKLVQPEWWSQHHMATLMDQVLQIIIRSVSHTIHNIQSLGLTEVHIHSMNNCKDTQRYANTKWSLAVEVVIILVMDTLVMEAAMSSKQQHNI